MRSTDVLSRSSGSPRLVSVALALTVAALAGCGGSRPSAAHRQMCWMPSAAAPVDHQTVQEDSAGAGGSETTSTGGGEQQPESMQEESPSRVDAEVLATGTRVTASAGSSSDEPECVIPREAPPWQPLVFTLAPDQPSHVLLAELELPPGAYFRPPTSSCQDVIVLVRDGELEASGTGVAPGEARTTLYVGDAVRFGPEGDGVLLNSGERPARTLLAVARDGHRFLRTTGWENLEPQGGDCQPLDQPIGASPLRVGSIATTERLTVSPDLGVQIMLDTEGHGAENAALSVLDGSPTVSVPSHTHDGSAEILIVDEGHGTLTLRMPDGGDREIPVAAGARLYIPAGVPHAFTSDGTSRLHAVQFYAPAGPEQRFRPASQ